MTGTTVSGDSRAGHQNHPPVRMVIPLCSSPQPLTSARRCPPSRACSLLLGGESPAAHWVTLKISTANSEGLPGTCTHWLSEEILSALPHFPHPPALQENSLWDCQGSHYYYTLQRWLGHAECLG